MAAFAADLFAGTAGTELSAYSSSWSKLTGTSGSAAISSAQRVRRDGTAITAYRHSAVPPSADYKVEADLEVFSGTYDGAGVIARASSSALTCYMARHYNNGYGWQLFKYVSGALYQLGSDTGPIVTSGATHIELRVEGTTIQLYKAGETTPAISLTDSSITAAGFAGIYFRNGASSGDTSGIHLDNFTADTLGAGVPAVTLTGLASGEAFGTASIARQAVTAVTLSGLASSEAFGTLSISSGALRNVTLAGISSGEAVGNINVARISHASVSLNGIPSSEVFGSAAVTAVAPGQISLTGIASGEAVGTAVVSFTTQISPGGLPSGEAFGVASITRVSRQAIALSGLASAEAIGTVSITRAAVRSLGLASIISGEAFGVPSFASTNNTQINLASLSSAEAFGSLVVSGAGTRTLTEQDLKDIADAVWAHPKALTFARYIGLN